jgi:hypothetical protein
MLVRDQIYLHEVTLSFKRRVTVFGYTAACCTQLRLTFEHLRRADISGRNLYEIPNRPAGVAKKVFCS